MILLAALLTAEVVPAQQPAVGQGVYQRHCAACHGKVGEGAVGWRKPNPDGELPAPPHGPEGHTWRHSDRVLFQMIAKGWRDPFNKTSRLTMPAFEKVLTEKEINSVIAYLKTLWTPAQRARQVTKTQRDDAPEQ